MAAQPIAHDDSAVSRLIAKVDGMAVLPHVVFRVLEISNAAESSIADLDRAIAVDPGFSAKVLTMANSAYFGLPRQVTSIRDALVFLGIKTIRNLAMTIGVFDLFVGKTDKESLRRRAWWRHSLDTAIAAKYLAMLSRKSNPDDAYTCGLMHLIGKTLMDRYGGLDYGNVLHLVGCGWDEEKAEQSPQDEAPRVVHEVLELAPATQERGEPLRELDRERHQEGHGQQPRTPASRQGGEQPERHEQPPVMLAEPLDRHLRGAYSTFRRRGNFTPYRAARASA